MPILAMASYSLIFRRGIDRFVADAVTAGLAGFVVPDLPLEEAMDRIRGWNLHIFAMRKPRGLLLGGDVVFVEPPQS